MPFIRPAAAIPWLPAPGTVATVGLNTIAGDATVNPKLDPTVNPIFGGGTSPWHIVADIDVATVYSGCAYAPLLGSLGSLLMTMSGHSEYNDNSVYRYDIATRLVSALTRPYGSLQVPFRNGVTAFSDLQAGDSLNWYSDQTQVEYYASAARASSLADQPAGFQSYNTLIVLPPGVGGAGAKGALLTTQRSATSPNGSYGASKQAHLLDLAAAEANPAVGWTRFAFSSVGGCGQGNAVYAASRGKVYSVFGPSGSCTSLRVLDVAAANFSDLSVSGGAGGYIGHSLISNMCHSAALDLLFVAGVYPNGVNVFDVQVLDISGSVCTVTLPPAMTGTVPGTGGGGGEWVEEHQAYYYYEGLGGFTLYKIVPPSNPRTQAWTSTAITLTGTTPFIQDDGVSTIVQHGSRLKWSPAAKCFLWWSGNAHPIQVFRLPT